MRAPAPTRRRRLALLACTWGALALVAGCASGGARGGGGERIRVTVLDYTVGRRFELASESHTDRVTYYSRSRHDASRKVLPDGALAALLRHLDDIGLEEHEQPGRAPAASGGVITRAFEVERDGEVGHWAIGEGSVPEERIAFNDCLQDFLQTYNLSASYQTVENPAGAAFFESERAAVNAHR